MATKKKTTAGKYVVVRSNMSGVWIGALAGLNGDSVTLTDARKIWSWQGANTTSHLALTGPGKGSRIAPPVTVAVFGVCEVITATEEARAAAELYEGWA